MIETSALVDSNVIIDIIGMDTTWMPWSIEALNSCESPWINPLVFAELCYVKNSTSEVEDLLVRLALGYLEIPKDALFLAAQAYKIYSKHTLKSYADAVKQLRTFKAVLPISTRSSESSAPTQMSTAYSSRPRRTN